MPLYSLSNALKLLRKKDLKKSKITILGLAFRGGVADSRLSPTYTLVKKLLQLKITNIIIHDPLSSDETLIGKSKTIQITKDLEFAISNRDLIILSTDHMEYSSLTPEQLGKTPIYDGRGLLDYSLFDPKIFKGIGHPK